MTPKKNIPTKTELVQLQKLYKTDEKIGERLGGVPAYLVAYWRRKKNVPKYSLPKFSEREIMTLWERFGDDEKCGLELGISKAAFYNWRRRYGIREKPAFLKLEQLEFEFPGLRSAPQAHSLYGEQTIAQKILARAAGKDKVVAGSSVEVEPDLVSANTNSNGVIDEFVKLSQGYVWNAGKIVITNSGISTNGSVSVGEFVRRQGIKTVYDLREGHCSQVLLERGHVRPGQLIFGTEPSVSSLGCIGAMAVEIDSTDTAAIWAQGKMKITVPSTIKVELTGRRARGVYTRDITAGILKRLENIDCNGSVIEFTGLAVSQMNVSERFTLCYLTKLIGAKAAITPYNSTVRRYLTGRASSGFVPVQADKNALYKHAVAIDISEFKPMLYTGIGSPKVKRVAELEHQNISQIVLGTCANGRFDDLRVAADILKGHKVHSDCRLFLCPASRMVYLEALKKGLIRVFVESGAVVMNPGGETQLENDNTLLNKTLPTLSTSVGNITGKEIYFCSPATAAASSMNAAITDPSRFVR